METAAGRVYNISLSTMWGIKNFPIFNQFFPAAARMGFAAVELNHQVSQSLLETISLNGTLIRSIHEPCPALIPAGELRKEDILISSPDEERRREGVNAIRRSIDLAGELGNCAVIVHAGQIQPERSYEKQLFALFEQGQVNTPEYDERKDHFTRRRAALGGPYLEAVMKSLRELLAHAARKRVHLGIENRYHYFDIPIPDEMAQILEMADPDRLGFIYDVGHAQTLDRLGFFPHASWLTRFTDRIIGAHLHDVVGIDDHRAPGLGEMDFCMVAKYLPPNAFRTLEVLSSNTPDQISKSLEILVDTGCIQVIQ
jgi:sugar phosphate isomerase/epimerase